MGMTREEYRLKEQRGDEIRKKAYEFLRGRAQHLSFMEIVGIGDDGTISYVPTGFTEEVLHELFKHLGMTALEFREFLRTEFQLRIQAQEWRRNDPNCEEYYEDPDDFGGDDLELEDEADERAPLS